MGPAPEPRGGETPKTTARPAVAAGGAKGGPSGLSPAVLAVALLSAGALAVCLSGLSAPRGGGLGPAAPPAMGSERSAPAAPTGALRELTEEARGGSGGDLVPYSPTPPRFTAAREASGPAVAPDPAQEEPAIPRATVAEVPAARTAQAAPKPKLKIFATLAPNGRKGAPFIRPLQAPAAAGGPVAAAAGFAAAKPCEGCENSTNAQFPDMSSLGGIPSSWMADQGSGGGSPQSQTLPAAFTSDGSGGTPADWRNCPPKGR